MLFSSVTPEPLCNPSLAVYVFIVITTCFVFVAGASLVVIALLCCCVIAALLYCFIILLCYFLYRLISLLLYCFVVLLLYCFIVVCCASSAVTKSGDISTQLPEHVTLLNAYNSS